MVWRQWTGVLPRGSSLQADSPWAVVGIDPQNGARGHATNGTGVFKNGLRSTAYGLSAHPAYAGPRPRSRQGLGPETLYMDTMNDI